MNQIKFCLEHNLSTPFDMGFFEPSAGGGGGLNNFVFALMIIEFGTDVKHDVFHKMVTKVCNVTTIT